MEVIQGGRADLHTNAIGLFLASPIGAAILELALIGSYLDEQPYMPTVMRWLGRRIDAVQSALARARELGGSASLPGEVVNLDAAGEAAVAADPSVAQKSISVYQPPSTLSFLTSRYAITLALLAILVNRIQHVVPPRRMFTLRSWARVAIRVPSIVMLTEAMLLVAAQMPRFAEWLPAALLRSDVESERVMWTTFLALVVSCVSETFVRALDNDRFRNPPFNLLSFGFMLHWHSVAPAELQPNEAVYGLVFLTMAETLSLVVMDACRLRLRLIVTAAFSLLGQYAMCRILLSETLGGDQALIPVLQYANRFPELLFQIVAVFTVACSVLSQLFVDGRVSFARTFGHSSTLPDASDDFATSVIRYGSACLETSALAGLGNELASVSKMPYIHLGRGQAGPIVMPLGTAPHDGSYGLLREVREIRAKVERPDTSDSLSRSTSVSRESWAFMCALVKLAFVVERSVARELGCRLGLGGKAVGPGRLAKVLRFIGVEAAGAAPSDPTWSLRRWLRSGRTVKASRAPGSAAVDDDDAEDQDFVPSGDESDDDGSSSASDAEAGSRESSMAPEDGPLVLYGDLEHDPVGPSPPHAAPAPPLDLLLAHLHSNGSPLTRRRFASDMDTALSDTILARRRPRALDDETGEAAETSLCVVCRCEPRSIITWPCRCLVLCDDCRQHLATKAGPTQLCVTCRRPIDGFSKVFTP